MTEEEIRSIVVRALGTIAPEADLGSLRSDRDLRDQLDIDSVDFMNFILAVHADLGIDIPEADYPKLSTLDDCVKYLLAKHASP